ncbi:hypothetical protein AB0M46_08570 [Dactylosporangium sp. NPDC051485]|uniref:hypothetical protein n=1 Tax=Dactylosporangium sp. NPDC051485 TaxID=3154846 RepID=UPI00343E21F6
MSVPMQAPVQRGRPSNVLASLERTRLGLGRLVASAFAAVAPATVVFGGATGGWAVTGVVQMPLVYIAVAVVLAVFSVGYVAMSRQIVNTGAFYSYITAGLGRIPGVAAAMTALQAYTVMQVGLAGAFGYGLHQTLLAFGHDVPWWLLSGAACLVVAVFGLLRVDLSGTILAVLLAAELVIVLVFAAVHIAHPANGVTTFDALSPVHLSLAGYAVAACVTIAGYVGFESAFERFNSAGAPIWGSLIQTLLAAATVVLFAARGWDPFLVLFFAGTVLGGFGVLLLMTVTSAAVTVYFAHQRHRRDNFGIWPTFVAPVVAAVLLTVVTVLTVRHFDLLVGVPATSAWRYTLPASFAVTAVVGAARAVYLRAARPSAYAGIGQGAPDLGATAQVDDQGRSR